LCHKFEQTLTENWNRNVHKFEIYVARNLLDSRTSQHPLYSDLKEKLDKIRFDASNHFDRNIFLNKLHNRLHKECKDADDLLVTLASIIFEIRIKLQGLESNQLSKSSDSFGLIEITTNLSSQLQMLNQLQSKAECNYHIL
jgi:hypothetical protein